jgi:hypothetical protein
VSVRPTAWLTRWLGAAWVALALPLASPAAGQQPQDQVVNLQLAYNAARSQYQAALDAWRVVEKQWTDAVEDHEAGRRAGDQDRENTALVRALDKSRELDLSERRVAELRGTLDRARTGLLGALDLRMEQVDGQLAAARTPIDRNRLAALLRDLQNQQDEVDAARDEPAVKLQLVYYPSIQFDVRDTPETMVGKAQLLRAKAGRADSYIAQIDGEIDRLEKQLRFRRNAQSLAAEVERFGDAQAPLGAPSRRVAPGDASARPDSTGVARPQETPEQRLEELRLLRVQMQEAKRQFLERAATFEERVRRIG